MTIKRMETLHYYRILFFIFFISFIHNGQSQDSLWDKPQHSIGFGIQHTANTSKTLNYFSSRVNYPNPGFNLFYRFIFPATRNFISGFSAETFYRNGHGYKRDGGRGGSSSYEGNFEFIKASLGLSLFARPEEYGNFMIGAGFYGGALIYSNGTIVNINSGSVAGESSSPAKNVLNSKYFAFGIEMNYTFKLNSKKFLILGLRENFESNDFLAARKNLTTTLYLSYSMQQPRSHSVVVR